MLAGQLLRAAVSAVPRSGEGQQAQRPSRGPAPVALEPARCCSCCREDTSTSDWRQADQQASAWRRSTMVLGFLAGAALACPAGIAVSVWELQITRVDDPRRPGAPRTTTLWRLLAPCQRPGAPAACHELAVGSTPRCDGPPGNGASPRLYCPLRPAGSSSPPPPPPPPDYGPLLCHPPCRPLPPQIGDVLLGRLNPPFMRSKDLHMVDKGADEDEDVPMPDTAGKPVR